MCVDVEYKATHGSLSPVTPLVEIGVLGARELRRSVLGAKGAALFVLALLGAGFAWFVCASVEHGERVALQAGDPSSIVEVKRRTLEQITNDPRLADSLAKAPLPLLALLHVGVWLVPLFVALVGFNAVASELQQRTIRYWAARARRTSILVAKVVGVWAVAELGAFVVMAVAGGAAIAHGYATGGELAFWGFRFGCAAMAVGIAWAAIATLVSACSTTPGTALFATCASFFALWLVGAHTLVVRISAAASGDGGASWYELSYPNTYEPWLLSPNPARVASALAALALIALVATTAGAFVLAKRDV